MDRSRFSRLTSSRKREITVKPVLLTLKNFGPYINETIDFTQFEDSSLFLISGKTGAGKTTIFDGMSYALFGESSGKLRSGKEMRSTFADPSEATEVTLVFAHGDYIYEMNRKPEQELFKKRGDGVRKQPAKISLIVKDSQGKELRAFSKRREVDDFIQELLHLDANQFGQIVLLPQGEFRTFLIANSNDKEKVLRNLFGTQLYQAFSDDLKERLKEANQGIQETQQLVQLKMDQLFWVEKPAEAQPILEMLDLLAEQQATLAAQQGLEKQAIDELKSAKQLKEQEKLALIQQQELQQRKTALLLEQEAQQLRETEMKQLRETQQQIRWGQQHQALFEKISEKRETIQQVQLKLAENRLLLEKNQQTMMEWQTKEQVHQQQKQAIEALADESQTIAYQLPLYKQYEALVAEKAEQEAQLIAAQTIQKDLVAKQTELQTEIQAATEKIAEEANWEKAQGALSLKKEQWQHFVEAWQRLNEQEVQLKQSQGQLTEFLVQLTDEQKALAERKQQLTEQKSHWASLQIQRLSLLLVDGEPCPVCGSLEHPKEQKHQETSLTEIQAMETKLADCEEQVHQQEEKVIQLQAKTEQLQTTLVEKQRELEAQQQKVDRLLNDVSDFKIATNSVLDQTLIDDFSKQLNEEATTIQAALTSIQTEKATLQDLTTILEQQQIARTEQQEITDKLAKSVEASAIQLQTIQQQLGDSTVTFQELEAKQQTLIQQVEAWQTEQALIEKQSKTCHEEMVVLKNTNQHLTAEATSTEETLQTLEAQLVQILAEKNIDEATLQNWLAQGETLETLHTQIEAFEKAQQQLLLQLADIEEKLTKEPLPAIEEVTAGIDKLQETIETKEASYYQLQEKMTMNTTLVTQIKQSLTAIEDQLEEVTALQQLTDTMNGNNPQKISLERYVLQTYLEKVLQVANQRLGLLTNNRYQFELNQSAGSYKNQTGLEINIYDDNSGTVRSAHTLSGGESFIAALALALSLAEVIQEQAGGVIIDALFIDEGFGSLDEEALEMAMEALETIENEGRMIGIISHVGELKARIPQQLQIKTNGNGQSKVNYQLA